ncbi:16S rRNA (guanine(966)-N(2))-methyltransferase RsmD [Alkalimarinus alittae]|uniref:Ribosomal RNA small subunit methyltransferase D n=1 Tax=Alkalimarinus alittae TaxID=2961619 RepID=A0ABY6N374_9ALTE|nr:16S rRNA (guanine(966)-N(2))-methyltransferase RsmD [Alkalimarinus alittae]UZE96560.1 16S rRNA (guanine(966)-N(2))-methyltransferase RsmD [Alkalimarinus alittae]
MANRKPNKHNAKGRKNSEVQSTLRIIGGQWRSRRLSFSAIEGLRPTTDRVRETLFNWVSPIIPGARCLDLFTGSGALGLEALSREASSVTFIDQSPVATRSLKQNLQLLQATNADVLTTDAVKWLKNTTPDTPYNIVFVDPPFRCGLVYDCLEQLKSKPFVTTGAYIYIEIEKEAARPQTPTHWRLHREKEAGQVRYMLFICE